MTEHQKAMRRCYGDAMKALRDKYPDDFHALLQAEYEAAGLSVKKRLTGERKRNAEIAAARALLADAGEVVISD